MTFLADNAESLFEPKKIKDSGDWLLSQKEGRQSYKWYADGNGGHKWLGGERQTIYLFCIDDSITPDNA